MGLNGTGGAGRPWQSEGRQMVNFDAFKNICLASVAFYGTTIVVSLAAEFWPF